MAASLLEVGVISVFTVSGALLAALAYVVTHYRDARGTREFVVLLVLGSLWSFGAAFKLLLPSTVEAVFVGLELIYGFVFTLTFLVFAGEYTGRGLHRRRSIQILVALVVAVAVALHLTNSLHSLLWVDLARSDAVFPHVVHVGKGPAYWAFLGGSYFVSFVGLYYLLDLHVRSRYNTQSLVLVMLGVAVAMSANLLSLIDSLAIPGLDYTPFGLAIFGVATTTAIHQDLFAIVPIARDTAVEFSGEGMIICDTKRRVRDYNEAATELFPGLPDRVDEPVSTVIPHHVVRFDPAEGHTGEVQLTLDGEDRDIDVRTTPISEGAHHLGWTVVCNDVTEQKRRERHLSLVARVLRHNMANEITIIQGKAELLRDAVADPAAGNADSIIESSQRIMTTSAKLRTIHDIVTDDRGRVPTNLGRFVESVASDASERFPDARVQYDAPDVWVRSTTGLGAALENLVENGLVHNDADEPHVTVRVDVGENAVTVAVCDNGPGIPPNEQRILDEGETPLQHSSGVGLWLVYRYVERSGRDLSFDRPPGGGSRVSFVLERADAPA